MLPVYGFIYQPKPTYRTYLNQDCVSDCFVSIYKATANPAGMFTFLLVLIFRPPRELVFFDRLCIDQRNHKRKMEGVLNIGACLKRSEKLLVIWDSSYCLRLWCIFELAAFLRTHETRDMLVLPLSVAILCVFTFMVTILFSFTSLFLPFDSELTFYAVVAGLCVLGWLSSAILLNFTDSVEASWVSCHMLKLLNRSAFGFP